MIFDRPEVRIHAFDLQKMIEDFTLSPRPFTAFSATKLDHIVRFYEPLLKAFMYAGFDVNTNEAKFVLIDMFSNPVADDTVKKISLSIQHRAKLLKA